jgi:hypothetical protein
MANVRYVVVSSRVYSALVPMINDKICVNSSVADPDPDVLGLPDPDPLVRGTDPALDPSTIKQKWVRYGSK